MVFETLAVTGGMPNARRVGNVISVPDPTTVLMVPAAMPASRMATISQEAHRPAGASPAGHRGSAAAARRSGAADSAPARTAQRPSAAAIAFCDLFVRAASSCASASALRADVDVGVHARAGPPDDFGMPGDLSDRRARGPRAPCRSPTARSTPCWRRPRRSSASSGGTGRPAATGRAARRGSPGRPSGSPAPHPAP